MRQRYHEKLIIQDLTPIFSMMLDPHETAPLRAGKEVHHGPL